MKVDEVIQQPGTKERLLKENILKSIHVAIPGEIVSYDSTQRTAVIQPVIRDWNSSENPPLLLDVPVFMWGNFTFTPTKGDGCLVVCADSCIDAWLQSGGVSSPVVARNHSLSDGFAFVGFNMTGGKDLPSELENRIKYTPQSLTDAQQQQARSNISAMYGKAIRLKTGDDLNNVSTPGVYEIADGVANSPTAWAGMLVTSYNSTRYQIIFRRDRVWVRDFTGNPPNWGEWYSVGTMAGTLPNNTDLNTLVVPGYYHIDSSLTYSNVPTGTDSVLVFKSSSSSTNAIQICFGKTMAPMHRFRTAITSGTNVWSDWIKYADDSKVVHNTGDETVAGTKKFTSALLFEREASNAGQQYSVLRARFKNQDGTVQFEAIPVRIIGTSAGMNYNAGVVLGSNSGTTVVGAGEGSAAFTSKNNIFDDENLYLVTDSYVRIYAGVENDGTPRGYYHFGSIAAGRVINLGYSVNYKKPTVQIPQNADLNSYKTPGSYEIYNSAVTNTLSHCPFTGVGGRLDVFEVYYTESGYIRQVLHKGGGNPDTFIRESEMNGTFGAWYKINMTQV